MSLKALAGAPFVKINPNGMCSIEHEEYPVVGFGTAHMKRTPELCFETVKKAAGLGYRILDTATRYNNFGPMSLALEGCERQRFYIISKAWHNAQTPSKLKEDLENTLAQLKITYLDAYFLHWPNSQIPIKETLQTMELFRQKKLIRHIGLSNVTVNHLKKALKEQVPITWVQMEMSPFFYDPILLAFCHENGIAVQAAAPLHEKNISEDPLLSSLGRRYQKTAAQVALRWIIQHGCIPLPRSSNPEHMLQNKNIFDFKLTDEEMEEINRRAKVGTRTVQVRGEAAKMEGFTDEFDFSYEQCWPT